MTAVPTTVDAGRSSCPANRPGSSHHFTRSTRSDRESRPTC
ncbi:hypothetical protein ABZ078_05865 [Streptomyces sp. NPDC006385]